MNFFREIINEWRKISYLLDHSGLIIITTHVNPDGDAIGSEMALAGFLTGKNIPFRIINHSPTPERFQFLDPDNIIELCPVVYNAFEFLTDTDTVIFLDLGRYDRAGKCGEMLAQTNATKVVIDHHPPEQIDADVRVVIPRAASTGSLVYDLMCHVDETLITKDIALALLTAIVTDTGYFRYSNTKATTHLIAASLYTLGAKASDVRKYLETGYPFCRQKLLGLTLSNLRTSHNGEIAYAHITQDMFREAGAEREHTDGIIDHMRHIENIRIAALIIEDGEGRYKVSFRSGGKASVNGVATLLGGGGHPKAAGANMDGSLAQVTEKVLDAIEIHLMNS